jgi:RNA polymerase primary sigma factor
MASKVASVADAAETREEAAEAPLLDQIQVAIKKMMARGKERGYVTYDELNAALPTEQVSSEQIEDTMTSLSELGINVVENEDSEETASAESEDGDAEVRGNLDDDDIGRTDDPVRMYLREMGSVELLSREGEIAIAKRIEAGREMMIGGLCESPLTVRALMLWRDALAEGKMLLRDIIDLDATYAASAIDPSEVVMLVPAEAVGEGEEEDEEVEAEGEEVAAEGAEAGEEGEGEESSISLAAMEAQLRPGVVAIFDEIAEIHKKLNKLQDQRITSIVKGSVLPRATDRRYDKHKDEAVELLRKIRFNNTRGSRPAAAGIVSPSATATTSSSTALRSPRSRWNRSCRPANSAASCRPCSAASARPAGPRRRWSRPTSAWSSRSPRSTPTAGCNSST